MSRFTYILVTCKARSDEGEKQKREKEKQKREKEKQKYIMVTVAAPNLLLNFRSATFTPTMSI